MTQGGMVGDEDCLTLDVATSSVVYNNPMPVAVYLPGDDDTLRPSTALAYSQGVVWVTVNVRQGVLGFLSHSLLSGKEQPPTSGNYGLGDLVTALNWVKTNIRHFGGDPDRVTVLGHQQGASLALALTAVASADGLYSRVWATAGAARLGELSLAEANEQWKSVVAAVCSQGSERSCLVEADAGDLLVQPVEQYWAHDDLPSKGEREMAGWLVADSKLLPNTVAEVWKGKPVHVPIVIGKSHLHFLKIIKMKTPFLQDQLVRRKPMRSTTSSQAGTTQTRWKRSWRASWGASTESCPSWRSPSTRGTPTTGRSTQPWSPTSAQSVRLRSLSAQ